MVNEQRAALAARSASQHQRLSYGGEGGARQAQWRRGIHGAAGIANGIARAALSGFNYQENRRQHMVSISFFALKLQRIGSSGSSSAWRNGARASGRSARSPNMAYHHGADQ